MTLKEMLERENLLHYVPECKNPNRIRLDSYEPHGNGYIIKRGKMVFRVSVVERWGGLCYEGERANQWGMFDHISCMTRTDEKLYPLVVAWVGTALVAKANAA
jgi:hypothetical protein